MAISTQVIRQRDFSGGELLPNVKRRDDVAQVKAGARSMLNWQIESPGNLRARSGRWARVVQDGRTEIVLMPGDVKVHISFGNGTIVISDVRCVQLASNSGYPWTAATVNQIVYAVVNRDIFICFGNTQPQVARRNPADGTWSFFAFTFLTGTQGELRAPFYRFPETSGITIQPFASADGSAINSAASGTSVRLISSASYFVGSSLVGSVIRYKKRQIQITALVSSTQATGLVLQDLPGAEALTVTNTALGAASASNSTGFKVGDIIIGQTSFAKGEITAVTATLITVQLSDTLSGFLTGETIVGPNARTMISAVAATSLQASVDWDEQAVGAYRGWPASCLYDRSRLALCNLNSLPEGIAWSAVGVPSDFYAGTDASSAIFEFAPGRRHVIHMMGGYDQFVFTNDGVFFIQISASNPLKPGSVSFTQITPHGCGAVKPIQMPEGIIYMSSGLNRVMAIQQVGAYTKPYQAIDISELSYHLINNPICIAGYNGDGSSPERLLYVVNADGSCAVGRFQENGDSRWVGWVPMTGWGPVVWATSLGTEIGFNVVYGTRTVYETVNQDTPLDGMVNYAALNFLALGTGSFSPVPNDVMTFFETGTPANNPLNPPANHGPLWMYAFQTVDLIDQGVDLGSRRVDALGFLILQEGDDFSSPTLCAGFAWTMTFEPFVAQVPEGRDQNQTLRRRRLITAAVTVEHSVGFTWANREVPPIFWGEDGDVAPAFREDTYVFRTIGRSFDPRVQLTRTRPGDIELIEVSLEVTF